MSSPLIVNLALTGMVPTKAHSPHVPIGPDEVAADVARCRELGVAIVHVHARDADGRPSTRAEHYVPLVEAVRDVDPELIVCVSCSGRIEPGLDARAEVLDLDGAAKPDMASLTLGSLNFANEASINAPAVVQGLAERMQERGIMPELEAFEPGMLGTARHLAEEGLIRTPAYVNLLFGNPPTAPLTPALLAAFLSLLPEGWVWAAAGIGRSQLPAAIMAIAAGGHVRVGLEDNLWLDAGRTRLATNRQLVERVVRIAELAERPIASPREARVLLDLAPVSVSE